MTEQEEFEFRARMEAEQSSAQPPATLRQKLQASVPMRIVQGMRDPIDGAAQLLPRGLSAVTSGFGAFPNKASEFFDSEARRVDEMNAQNEREYEQSRRAVEPRNLSSLITGDRPAPGMDVSRFVGNVLSPANAAVASRFPVAATAGARVLQGATLGAAGGLMTPVNTEDTPDFASAKMGQGLMGAVTGGIATPILGKVGDLLGSKLASMKKPSNEVMLKQAQRVAEDAGMDWEDLSAKARDELIHQVGLASAANRGLHPAAATRVEDFKAEGMPYLLGQVTREPGQFAREKNLSQLVGTGDPIKQRFVEQGDQLRQKVGKFGRGAADEQTAGASLVKALQEYDTKLSGGIKDAYRAARDSAGKDVEVPMQGLAQDFAEVLDNFGDKIPSGVLNNFRKYGVAPGGDMTQRKLFTVEEADKLLKVINANQSNDPATNAALSALRGSVKRAVTSDAGAEDVFAGARQAAASRFALQEAVPALEAAASGRVNPDTFVDKFVVSKGAQSKQVQELARILREGSPEAFDQAKAQIGAYLQRKAFGENPAGDAQFSPARYATALRELGPEKLKAFFSPEEATQLQRLSRISAYVDSVPNASKPNTSGNWGAITDLATKMPGVSPTVALAKALKAGVSNQLDVSKALSGKPPASLTPEEINLMSKLLSQGALATGGASGAQLR